MLRWYKEFKALGWEKEKHNASTVVLTKQEDDGMYSMIEIDLKAKPDEIAFSTRVERLEGLKIVTYSLDLSLKELHALHELIKYYDLMKGVPSDWFKQIEVNEQSYSD